MKKTNKIIIGVILVAILVLGIVYAAIQNITLNIAGTATVEPVSFNVKFTGTPVVSENTYVTATITNDTNAAINVRGLSKKGETATATYKIKNESVNLSAALSVATTNSNPDYFTISAQLDDVILTVDEETTVLVTVELTKEINQDTQTATIGVQLTAMPVDPNEEVDSDKTNDFSQTPEATITLAEVTNDNIGEYIDLGNNLVGTEATTDDWRIFYTDGSTVYAILADTLPAKFIPSLTGVMINDITGEVGTQTLSLYNFISFFTDSTLWEELANGIEGAEVVGSPSTTLFAKSYNAENGTEIVFMSSSVPDLDYGSELADLYMRERGFWLSTRMKETYLWKIHSTGVGYSQFAHSYYCVRPVVSLPSSTKAQLVDGVWKIVK